MKTDLKHGSLTDQILGVFYDVYNELGHGFLESVYHRSLVLALESVGLSVCSRVAIPVWVPGIRSGTLPSRHTGRALRAARVEGSTHPRLVTSSTAN